MQLMLLGHVGHAVLQCNGNAVLQWLFGTVSILSGAGLEMGFGPRLVFWEVVRTRPPRN